MLQNRFSWILQILIAVLLIQTVVIYKFPGHPDSVFLFSQLGMEPWGRFGTGIAEVIASILLLWPRRIWLGASMTVGLMLGAIYFHLTILGVFFNNDGGTLFGMAVGVLLASLIVLFTRRRQIPFLSLAA